MHGYLSATDVYDRSRLLKYIPDLPDDEDALFAFWDSGSMKDIWGDMLKSAAEDFSLSKLGVALGVFGAFKGGVDHFNGKKDHTREIGGAFFLQSSNSLWVNILTCKASAYTVIRWVHGC